MRTLGGARCRVCRGYHRQRSNRYRRRQTGRSGLTGIEQKLLDEALARVHGEADRATFTEIAHRHIFGGGACLEGG